MKKLNFIKGYFYFLYQNTVHKIWVFYYIIKIILKIKPENKWQLFKRSIVHDCSKYRHTEIKYCVNSIFKLKHTTYGSDDYKELLDEIWPSIKLHYDRNRHHPEYHKNGMKDMNKIDELEMMADWVAAVRRHKTGNIFVSLERNKDRFNYNDDKKEYFKSIVEKIL